MPGQRYQSDDPNPTYPARVPAPGQPAPSVAPVAAQRYRSGAPVLAIVIGVVVLALAVVLVWAGTRPAPNAGKTPTNSAAGAPTPENTPSPGWSGIEFTAPTYGATGYWQVGPPQWTGDTVTVSTTLAIDQGTMKFTFFTLENATSDYYTPIGGSMMSGTVDAGGTQTGTLVFQMPDGEFTLYLATARGSQVAALLVQG